VHALQVCALLKIVQTVQECDATMKNSSNPARLKKNIG
jgi:hypothetical protein